jgi:ATP-binding cassette, subfamily B, bacterial
MSTVCIKRRLDGDVALSRLEKNLSYDLKNIVSENQIEGLWRISHGFRPVYLAAIVSQGFAAAARSGMYLLLAHIVDHVLGQPSQGQLLPLLALAILLLALGEGLFSYFSGRWAALASEGIARRLRNYLFDHVQRMFFPYYDKVQTGDLIQRTTSDVDAIRRFFADQAIGLGRIALLFLVNFVALLTLNRDLAFASVVVIPVIIVMSMFFFKRISKAYEAYQEQESVTSTLLQENLSGVRVVKAFARQPYEIDKYDAANQERYRRGKKLIMYHGVYWPLTDVICGIQVAVGYFLGASMVLNNQLTVGAFIAYMGIIWQVINPLRNLGRIIVQMSEGGISYQRVMNIIRENREPLEEGKHQPSQPPQGRVAFNEVGFNYLEGKQVLQNITFTAEPGQIIALMGSTGSGKTSLVGLLPRFYEYTSGSITLDGLELRDYPRDYLRKQIGIVEQEPFLFSRSIRENIAYGVGRAVTDAEVEAAARAAAIHDVIMSFPEGYNTIVGEKGVTLSGGQKQRTAIARTLLKDPRLLILDDATSSVDTETEAQITGALKGLMKGRTSFVIAHRISTVMNADLILVLDKGHIVQRGTHAELMAQPGIYRNIYDVQTRIDEEMEKEIASV